MQRHARIYTGPAGRGLIAKANLNIAIVMQTFENHILQNCSTEFYDIAHTHGPWVLVIKVSSNGGAT